MKRPMILLDVYENHKCLKVCTVHQATFMKLSQQAYSLTLKRAITEEVQKMLIQNGLKSLYTVTTGKSVIRCVTELRQVFLQ